MATYSAIKYNVDLPTASTTLKSGNALELIKTLTASSSNDLTFVHGTSSVVFDTTYKTYIFIYCYSYFLFLLNTTATSTTLTDSNLTYTY